MRDQQQDHQLSLPLKEATQRTSDSQETTRESLSVTDLSVVRSARHAYSVLDRVVREGYTKK
jgi:hypothetical protein